MYYSNQQPLSGEIEDDQATVPLKKESSSLGASVTIGIKAFVAILVLIAGLFAVVVTQLSISSASVTKEHRSMEDKAETGFLTVATSSKGKEGSSSEVPPPGDIYLDTFNQNCPQDANGLNPTYTTWEMCQVVANAVNAYAAAGIDSNPQFSNTQGYIIYLFAYKKTSGGLVQVSSVGPTGPVPDFLGGKTYPCCSKNIDCVAARDNQFGPADYYFKCEYIDTATDIAPGGSFFSSQFYGTEIDYCVANEEDDVFCGSVPK
eukprot:gb/GEZN01016158.1/.p1 GENE.gb/GEZN01016158.1/~~gb/GEZN01016158.1/.p1  ORF type:complete len:261 (-),score=34.11 gb/GEZN01016158.1/:13-795(-)